MSKLSEQERNLAISAFCNTRGSRDSSIIAAVEAVLHNRDAERTQPVSLQPTKQVPEETISDECRWCREGEPEWSDHAKCWIHRRSDVDKRCLRKRLDPVGNIIPAVSQQDESGIITPDQEAFWRKQTNHLIKVTLAERDAEWEKAIDEEMGGHTYAGMKYWLERLRKRMSPRPAKELSLQEKVKTLRSALAQIANTRDNYEKRIIAEKALSDTEGTI